MKFLAFSIFLTFCLLARSIGQVLYQAKPDDKYIEPRAKTKADNFNCNLPKEIVKAVGDYGDLANQIIEAATSGKWKGRTYGELVKFTDQFGPRFPGTMNLEDSIDYMHRHMQNLGLEVYEEEVEIPVWVRGFESAQLLEPRFKKISMLGLGGSISTPHEGIEAEVIVFRNFDELEARKDEVQGKIVVYNQAWVNYGKTNQYRLKGASRAAVYGAKAVLIRSVASFSLNSPHTGAQIYDDIDSAIPAACITEEDAKLLHRLQIRGIPMRIKLVLENKIDPPSISRNLIGEIPGHISPNEIVGVSGHIDSWDVGEGVMDDGGGLLVSMESLGLLKFLNVPQPRRTIRGIAWTAEEIGLVGARQYVQSHLEEIPDWNAVIESDGGTFEPLGLQFAGSPDASCIIKEILKHFVPINTTQLRIQDRVASDIVIFQNEGVPGLQNFNEDSKYFWYHHTQGDNMILEDPDHLDKTTALFAITAYILADMEVKLPRGNSSNWIKQ